MTDSMTLLMKDIDQEIKDYEATQPPMFDEMTAMKQIETALTARLDFTATAYVSCDVPQPVYAHGDYHLDEILPHIDRLLQRTPLGRRTLLTGIYVEFFNSKPDTLEGVYNILKKHYDGAPLAKGYANATMKKFVKLGYVYWLGTKKDPITWV